MLKSFEILMLCYTLSTATAQTKCFCCAMFFVWISIVYCPIAQWPQTNIHIIHHYTPLTSIKTSEPGLVFPNINDPWINLPLNVVAKLEVVVNKKNTKIKIFIFCLTLQIVVELLLGNNRPLAFQHSNKLAG